MRCPTGCSRLDSSRGSTTRIPCFDPHVAFQRFKQHPLVSRLLAGGKLVRYGAKALPEGGWHTIPRVHMNGALIAGDAGSFLNSMRLKGIHLAMRTGMLAAETAFDAVRAGDTSDARLRGYKDAIDASEVRRELYPVRNVHQAFSHGLPAGVLYSGLALVTGGWWFQDPMPAHAGYERTGKLADYYHGQPPPADAPSRRVKIDRQLTFDRLTNVHYSGTRHTEDQPSHLIVHDTEICRTRCSAEYANPCTRFCPANVYEMVDDGQGGRRLHINASNCVHCKTCDIMDPYQIIDWVPPEGGEGPQYRRHVTPRSSGTLPSPVTRSGARTHPRSKTFQAAAIAAVGVPVIEALGGTYTWIERGREHLEQVEREGRPPIFAFWHGRILAATLYFRDRDIVVITSENFDGEWIARIIRRFGYGTARGSTSRGGARALVQLRRDLAEGRPAAFTIDGPRGPARVAQAGAVWLAGATGHPILPFHIEARRAWHARSWDRHQIPKPGSEVAIAIGEPMVIEGTSESIVEAGRADLERVLADLERTALAAVGR